MSEDYGTTGGQEAEEDMLARQRRNVADTEETTFELRRRNRGRWGKWEPWFQAQYAKGIVSLLVDAEWETVTVEGPVCGLGGSATEVLGVQYRKAPRKDFDG